MTAPSSGRSRARGARGFRLVITAVALSAACGGEAVDEAGRERGPPAQGLSLLGDPLVAQEDTAGVLARTDSLARAHPDSVGLLLELARDRAGLWLYREAIELYDQAAAADPDDWRPYRHRGHRMISVRRFPRAVQDLETARRLAPTSFDVAYHLGLAYYLTGLFDEAAAEYRRCMDQAEGGGVEAAPEEFRSCASVASDPESRVALTEWLYRSLRRAGRQAEASALLDAVPADLPIGENLAYYHDLLFYKGLMAEEELLAGGRPEAYRFETVAYGIASWHLVEGDTARAVQLMEDIVTDPVWPGFGRLAAEADLVQLR